MDKNIKTDNIFKQKRNHSITIENRKKLTMTGVEKVVSSSETQFSLLTSDGALVINGKNLKIIMYNIENGTFSAEGDFDAAKYTATKSPLLKRMFK